MNETIQSTLEKENSDHGDLIQVDLMDTYLNLTLKSVSLISWAFKRCGQVRYVVKCDDDVYVNVENLAKAFLVNLVENSNGEKRMFGEPALGALPFRYTGKILNSILLNYIIESFFIMSFNFLKEKDNIINNKFL